MLSPQAKLESKHQRQTSHRQMDNDFDKTATAATQAHYLRTRLLLFKSGGIFPKLAQVKVEVSLKTASLWSQGLP